MKIDVYTMDRCGRHSIINWMCFNHQDSLDIHTRINRNPNLDATTNWTGDGKLRVLIVRDPYNWLASWIKSTDESLVEEQIENMLTTWKSQAECFINDQEPFCTINIQFNGWHMCKNYRRFVAEQMGMHNFCDGNKQQVLGPGSAWDGLAYHGNASKMPVLERWRDMRDNKLYNHHLHHNREVEGLCRDIFGQHNPLKYPEKWRITL